MQVKLSYKLFGAFFLILVIVAGALFLSRYIFSLNFKHYIHHMEVKKLEQFLPALQMEYKRHGGWQHLRSDRDSRRLLLGHTPRGHRAPPGDFAGPGGRREPPAPPPSPVFLLDAARQPVVGEQGPFEDTPLVAIEVGGETVGWLGLHQPASLRSGPPAALMQRQAKQLILLGTIVLAVTALIAFSFSRYLLGPIQRLTRGTRELADRKFSVRIAASGGDELGQLAENFNTMAQTLDNFEKMRSQWLTDISHEMRTPLAILRGEIEALQDGVREPTDSNMASLHSEVERINRLVEDLHLLSKADSDSLVLNMQPIQPCRVLEQVAHNYENRLAERSISLELKLGNTRRTRIKGDADRLSQVYTNLFENVCKYVEAPGRFTISGATGPSAVTLLFQDSGPGVPDEALQRLFDRLFRVDPSRSRTTGGSGLGLSICQHIISNHDGTIWAEHSPMGGLSIGLRLPLV